MYCSQYLKYLLINYVQFITRSMCYTFRNKFKLFCVLSLGEVEVELINISSACVRGNFCDNFMGKPSLIFAIVYDRK